MVQGLPRYVHYFNSSSPSFTQVLTQAVPPKLGKPGSTLQNDWVYCSGNIRLNRLINDSPCFPNREVFVIMPAICKSPTKKPLGRHYFNQVFNYDCVSYIMLEAKRELYETMITIFYLTSKPLFILKKSNFRIFRYSSLMMPSNAKAQNKNTFYWIKSVNDIWPVYVIL